MEIEAKFRLKAFYGHGKRVELMREMGENVHYHLIFRQCRNVISFLLASS